METNQNHTQQTKDNFWDIVSTYTRKQAIEDGILVDVTETARRFFKYPTAMNIETWTWITKGGTKPRRVYFLLEHFYHLAKETPGDLIETNYLGEPLVCHIGPGDTPAPVLTICHPKDL